MNFGQSLLWLLFGYVTATLVGMIHVVILAKVFKIEGSGKGRFKPSQSPVYKATEPYHPLYCIVLFPVFSYIYFVNVAPTHIFQAGLILGLFWVVISILADLIGWVLIRHPWNMTFREMYVDYQPWISITYIVLLVSPLLGGCIYQAIH